MADDVASLRKKINGIPPVVRQAVVASLQKSGDELVAAQKALVPVRTGALRDSIRAELRTEELKVVITAGGPTTTKAARSGHGHYDYSLGVELGTADMAAEPFFYPAYRLLKKRLRSRTKRAVNKAIKDQWNHD